MAKKKSSESRRTKVLMMRVTSKEHATFTAKAKAEGLRVADWMRTIIKRAASQRYGY